ncbi:MAG TPA: DinB family protein [Bryobacteraceae bacterium]|nr:DinB family protein [Bryobacteraceae bacterium]
MKEIVLALLVAAPVFAQTPSNPMSADLKATWNQIKANIAKSAEKMPEENYAFKPTPEVRSFGQLIAHVADANYMICGAAKGEQKSMGIEKSKTSKADLIAALAESAAYCDSAYDALTDASAAETVRMFGRERSRMGALQMNMAHDFEHYGNLVTYLRMKGLVPPSSEPRR